MLAEKSTNVWTTVKGRKCGFDSATEGDTKKKWDHLIHRTTVSPGRGEQVIKRDRRAGRGRKQYMVPNLYTTWFAFHIIPSPNTTSLPCSALSHYLCCTQSPGGYFLGMLNPSLSGHHIMCWGLRVDMKKNEVKWQSALHSSLPPPQLCFQGFRGQFNSSGIKCTSKDPSLEKLNSQRQ